MIEVTDEMKQALTNIQHGFQLISCEGGVKLVFSDSFLEKALTRIIELHEANKQHLVTKDAMTNCVHVLPMDFVKDLSNGTQNLKHLSEKERDAIVRCIANTVVESCNPTPNPVGYVKTVGGYPDESEHRAEWVVKYKELKDGQPLYTTPPTREPLSDDALDNMLWKADSDKLDGVTMRQFKAAARLIEQAHGIK